MFIEIDNLTIEVFKKPIKNINVRIYPPLGEVKVSAPLKCSRSFLVKTLQEKIGWIKTQRTLMQKKQMIQQLQYETGDRIDFLGVSYGLRIHEGQNAQYIEINGDHIDCYLQYDLSTIQRKNLLAQWFRQEMKLILPARILYWEEIIQVKVLQWGIKTMKTRWGSCNTRAQRIWLNLNLIQKPPLCLEYVLVHELIHLLEPSHNQRFYDLMNHYMPLWMDYKRLLEGR